MLRSRMRILCESREVAVGSATPIDGCSEQASVAAAEGLLDRAHDGTMSPLLAIVRLCSVARRLLVASALPSFSHPIACPTLPFVGSALLSEEQWSLRRSAHQERPTRRQHRSHTNRERDRLTATRGGAFLRSQRGLASTGMMGSRGWRVVSAVTAERWSPPGLIIGLCWRGAQWTADGDAGESVAHDRRRSHPRCASDCRALRCASAPASSMLCAPGNSGWPLPPLARSRLSVPPVAIALVVAVHLGRGVSAWPVADQRSHSADDLRTEARRI